MSLVLQATASIVPYWRRRRLSLAWQHHLRVIVGSPDLGAPCSRSVLSCTTVVVVATSLCLMPLQLGRKRLLQWTMLRMGTAVTTLWSILLNTNCSEGG